MPFRRTKLSPFFNFQAQGRSLGEYTITLCRPTGQPEAQAEDFKLRLMRWLQLQGDDRKGNAQEPHAVPAAADGYARVSLSCTEETMLRIERQFAGDILAVAPPPQHQRGTVYPPRVDPWDITKW